MIFYGVIDFDGVLYACIIKLHERNRGKEVAVFMQGVRNSNMIDWHWPTRKEHKKSKGVKLLPSA